MHWRAWNEPAEPVMPATRTFVFLSTKMAIFWEASRLSRGFDGSDDFARAVVHRVGGLNREPALRQDLLAELDVRAFEPHYERHLEPELLGRRDDALGDHVALHDAAEDVDEDAFDLRARQDHAEGLLHLFFGGAAAHVQKVRGRAAVVLNDVHGRHREAGAVHQATDVAVERH